MITVLIVDDHALVRLGIKRLLSDVDNIHVVGEAESGEDAITLVRNLSPQVVLLDVKMPGIGGIETIRRITRSFPSTKVIALSAFCKEPFPTRVIQAGAHGFLSKETGLEEMIAAIEKVACGQRYLTKEIAEQLAFKTVAEAGAGDAAIFEQLTEREMQVLLMICGGVAVPEISDKLCLSTKTVNTYRYRLFEKLTVKNDVELTLFALRHNLIENSLDSEA